MQLNLSQKKIFSEALLNEEELKKHAKEIANYHTLSSKMNWFDKSIRNLSEDYKIINEVYIKLLEEAKNEKNIIPAAEWLLDNFYIIEENTKEIKRDFKLKLYKNLPILRNHELDNKTRISEIANEMVLHTDGRIDENVIMNYVNSYQEVSTLQMKEIWVLGTFLRISLITKIRILSESIYEAFLAWKKAKQAVELLSKSEESNLTKVLGDFSIIDSYKSAFLEHLAYLLRRSDREGIKEISRINEYIEKYGISLEELSLSEHNYEAVQKVSMGNAILSLKYISDINWNELFNSISKVEKKLLEDPSGIFEKMDVESKNFYRARIEKIAKSFRVSEIHVAKKANELATKNIDKEKKGHIGFYLFGKGKEELTKLLGNKSTTYCSISETIKAKPYTLYVGMVWAFSLIVLLIFGTLMFNLTDNRLYCIIALLLALFPIVDGGVCFINYTLNRIFKPRIIPRLELKEGIPKELATMVIVPTLISNKKTLIRMLENIETYYIASNVDNIYFTLVGDTKEADKEILEGDEEIIDYGKKKIGELNSKYGEGRFTFVYRKRKFNKSENKWLGWERKRGAILEYNRYLIDRKTHDYRAIMGDITSLPPIKYVITLDADTVLPIGVAKKLIGAMAHPINKPILNEKGTAVIDGYALIQPHISIDVVSANKSKFSRIFAGTGGIDPYVCASSDIYQDVFGEAIFTGKGIYDLEIFQQVLEGTIPENTVLSHDLLEGSYLRTGLITDVELVDGYPERYNSYALRSHRWVRGDWQIISWLSKKVKNQQGQVVDNPLNRVSKWKLFDNLRRSLTAPMLTLLIILSLWLLPETALWWIGLGIIAGIRGNKKQFLFQVLFLPFQAYLMASAIVVTLFRLVITHKNLLEWVTAADMERKLKNTIKSFYTLMWSSVAVGIIVLLEGFFISENIITTVVAILLGIGWIVAPIVAYYLSKPIIYKKEKLDSEEVRVLYDYAERTWRYFDEFVNEENNYLPPDNYQEDPPNDLAYRTSPTNIGLALLAFITANDLGFISVQEMINRLEKTIDTIEKLEKWNGHLLNWYDTKTLKPLKPRYISTVDSGNFLAYVLVAKVTLEQLEVQDNLVGEVIGKLENKTDVEALKKRIKRLINILDNIAKNMTFVPLYDKDKLLFSIGYNLEDGRLSNSYYDLLASESRQTSFLAIANHEVDKKHWFRLGRSLTKLNGSKGLVSWTGTMFEYLMPLLIMKDYNNTMLKETYDFVIKSHIEYAKKKNVPWGISESAFNHLDINLNYQYKAFGVPWLGLKRGLLEDTVISPYSTMLALMVRPKAAYDNLERLKNYKMLGKYGFYEAIDFTPRRNFNVTNNEPYSIVKSYMVHHQGMSLLSLNNVINDNIMQERFHSLPLVKSANLLLQEKVPKDVIYTKDNKEKVKADKKIVFENIDTSRYLKKIALDIPQTHILTNGSYSTMLTDRGLGYSKYKNIFISRWRNDYISSIYGNIFYIKDVGDNKVWSSTYLPDIKKPDSYSITFAGDKAKFIRKDGDIETHQEVVISPEDNVEIRRITLINHEEKEKEFEITSYFELIDGDLRGDVAHRAYSNLFVETFCKDEILLANRRKRRKEEKNRWIFNTSTIDGEGIGGMEYETDRNEFISRGRTLEAPRAVTESLPLTGKTGAVLDPIMAIRRRVRLKSGESIKVSFIVGVSDNREEAIELGKKYLGNESIQRAFRMALTRSQVENSYFNFSAKEVSLYEEMMSYLIFNKPIKKHQLAENIGRKGLWSNGISGDVPIILLNIEKSADIGILYDLLKAHEYYKAKNLTVDFVIMNNEETQYDEPVWNELNELIMKSHLRDIRNTSGGVYLLKKSTISSQERESIIASAEIVLDASKGSLTEQVERIEVQSYSDKKEYNEFIEYDKYELNKEELELFNGIGGIDKDSNEYVIKINKNQRTPLPWSNVLANKEFGSVITENGGGFTFVENSHECRITPWNNDSVLDEPGEQIYIRNEDNGKIFTPYMGREEKELEIRYGKGYGRYTSIEQGIKQELLVYIPKNEKIKISKLSLNNLTDKKRKFSLFYYIQPLMGESLHRDKKYVEVKYDNNKIIFKNTFNTEFKENIGYIFSSENLKSYTLSKTEFIGSGNLEEPEALKNEKLMELNDESDSVAVLQIEIELDAYENKEIVFALGCEKKIEDIEKIKNKYSNINEVNKSYEELKSYYNEINTIRIKTPDESMNYLFNEWLIYQALNCRINAKSAFYQSGGATGFRDQLQDVLPFIYLNEELAREQIIYQAKHQFREGDVLHWWHKEGRKGIRTRFSDDKLWLPYVVAEYLLITGKKDILDEKVEFVEADILEEHEEEKYIEFNYTVDKESIYQHCINAIEISLKFGEHGLPLIGSGDWNDGMNQIGHKGKGESVWLGWFLYDILVKFSAIMKDRGDNKNAERYSKVASKLAEDINNNAWDGKWYKRAYFDDGRALGSIENDECKIDSISQSWAVISGAGEKEKIADSMKSVENYLIDKENKIVKLLTPAFANTELEPGYIKGYLAGIRENGGQYTHAAVWLGIAYAILNDKEKAYEIQRLLNPLNHTIDLSNVNKYKLEPYVMPADIYSNEKALGRGGWSWYTGAAAWMYRFVIEYIIGLQKRGEKLIIKPCFPENWDEIEVEYRYLKTIYKMKVINSNKNEMILDGTLMAGNMLELVNDGGIHFLELKNKKQKNK